MVGHYVGFEIGGELVVPGSLSHQKMREWCDILSVLSCGEVRSAEALVALRRALV